MGHVAFIPTQGNWRWMDDDAAEPTVALADENVSPTLGNNNDIFRLRVRIFEVGGDSGQKNGYWKIQHSTNESDWTDLDVANHFNYANGQAIENGIVTTNKLSDTSGKGPCRESVGVTTFDMGAASDYEFDFAIVPTGNVSGSTLYYFRILNSSDGTGYAEIAVNSETHPQLTTASSVNHYTLEAFPNQTFVFTGIATDILKSNRLNAAPNQTFIFTGIAADILKGFYLEAIPNQTFALAGIDVTFTYSGGSYTLDCALGTFALAGITADVLKSNVLNASPQQTFALAGITADVLKSNVLNASPQQTFALAGINVNLIYSGGDYTLICDLGAFALTGQDGNLLVSKILSADAQTYSLTGINNNIVKGFVLSAIVDSIMLTGPNVDLLKSSILGSETEVFSLTGIDTNFFKDYYLNGTPNQAFALTGIDVTLTYSGSVYVLECGLGIFTLTNQDGNLLVSRILSLGAHHTHHLTNNVNFYGNRNCYEN